MDNGIKFPPAVLAEFERQVVHRATAVVDKQARALMALGYPLEEMDVYGALVAASHDVASLN